MNDVKKYTVTNLVKVEGGTVASWLVRLTTD